MKVFPRNDQFVCLHLWWKSWVSHTCVIWRISIPYYIVLCIMLCRAGVTWDIFILCSVRVRSGWFKLYEWILYYEPCEMKCHVHCVQLHALFVHVHYVRSSVWPCQRSSTWPTLELDVTLHLNYTSAKFHRSTPTRSLVIVRTDSQTDRRTDIA